MTETELKVMAALAIMGLSSTPHTGYSTPAARGTPSKIVDEGEKEILPDVLHGRPAESDGTNQRAQIAFHQRHARAFHGNVRSGSHRNPHVGKSQRRRIIDAIARHRDHTAL